MGTINHDAVLATTCLSEPFAAIEAWIATLPEQEQRYFAVTSPVTNAYRTVVLTPDGSKEGWGTSDEGDVLRAAFIAKIKEQDYEDGSNPWDFVEVSYGEYGARVSETNCRDRYTPIDAGEEGAGD